MDRKRHWEKIYSESSDANFSWFQTHPSISLDLIDHASIGLTDHVIDVGGGSSMLVDHLLDAGFQNLAVLDISANALAMARQRLGDQAEKIQWIESDITSYETPRHYELWHDRAVFHFLTDAEDRRQYVDVLRRALAPHGSVIIAAFAIGGPTMCSGLNVVQYDADKLSSVLGDEFRLVETAEEIHITPKNAEQAFQYFRFTRSIT
jgi:ubiquinone/menaquinone biosynthesis C-methylase UbiE